VARILKGEKMWQVPHEWSQAQLYYTMKALEEMDEKNYSDKNKTASIPVQSHSYPNLKSKAT
jgi:hypothetical protein